MVKKCVGLLFATSLILTICGCAPVTVDTVPSGATVYSADGQTQLGNTPYKTSVFVGEKNFSIRKDHYFDETAKLNFDSSRKVDLDLRPMPVLVYSKPDAEIFAVGSQASLGSTPMKLMVNDNENTYTLKASGYYDQDITVGRETTDPLVVKMVRRSIVTLSATPAGVEVYEKNKRIGTAPVNQEILTSHTFELRKPGYFTKTVTLTSAPPYEVAVELKPFPVTTLTSAPAGAQIYREGNPVGKTPAKFAIGKATVLEVRADRYYPQNITLTPESPAQVNVTLKDMPYITVNSSPAGAELFVGGKSVGVTPSEQLIEKDTTVELRKEGFVTKTATLTGADKQVTVTLEAVPPPAPVAPIAPTNPPVEEKKTAEVAAPVKAPQTGLLPWIIGGAVVAAAGLVLFLIKRKNK